MKFNTEANIRKWVKEAYPNRAFFVEASRGGTAGFPDAVIFRAFGNPTFLELKLGALDRKGNVTLKFTPGQPKILRRLFDLGADVKIAIGIKGTDTILLEHPRPEILKGRFGPICTEIISLKNKTVKGARIVENAFIYIEGREDKDFRASKFPLI